MCSSDLGFTASIDVGAGTFAGAIMSGKAIGQVTPIILTGAGATTIFNSDFNFSAGAWFQVQNLKVGSSGGNGIGAQGGGTLVIIGAGVNLTGAGTGSNGLLDCAMGAQINLTENLTFSGGGGYLMRAQHGGRIMQLAPGAIVITGAAVTFDAYTVGAIFGGEIYMPNTTFSGAGSVVGTRYQADINGIIYTTGSSPANYFPGNVAGSTARGGQYA